MRGADLTDREMVINEVLEAADLRDEQGNFRDYRADKRDQKLRWMLVSATVDRRSGRSFGEWLWMTRRETHEDAQESMLQRQTVAEQRDGITDDWNVLADPADLDSSNTEAVIDESLRLRRCARHAYFATIRLTSATRPPILTPPCSDASSTLPR